MVKRPAMCVLLLALGLPAKSDEPPERFLRPHGNGAAVVGPLDWVFEKVSTGADEWSIEKVNDDVTLRLKELAEKITALDLGEHSLDAFLATSFRSGQIVPHSVAKVFSSGGLEVERGEAPSDAVTFDRTSAELASSLRGMLPGVSRVEKAKFKVFRIHRHGVADHDAAGRVATRSLLETDGVLAMGGFLQVRAVWDCDWVEESGAWRIAELRPVSFERARLQSRAFSDVTASALRSNRSYREQFLVGLDAWRTRIDSASGIDIYGHQGVSVGDFDGDGWEDFYIAQPAGLPNRLFRNRGDGTFEDVTDAAGLGVLDNTGGALFVDADNDGDIDLVVVTSLEILLFENKGKGKFELRQPTGLEAAGHERASSMGCAAADYDLDGDLDLYCYSYVFWAGAGSKAHSSYPYPYHDANNGAPNFLFRNDGSFHFTDVTKASGLDVNNRRYSLAASWCDYDGDGDPDIYVANDFGKNNLYQNQGDGTFKDVAAQAGVEDTGNGMSVTWEDFDNDGRMDLYVGNMWSSAGSRLAEQPGFGKASEDLRAVYRRMARGNSLFRNLGGGRFEDVSISSGAYFGRWSWSCQFIDYDSDGREDLYVANGFVTNEMSDDL